MIGRQDYFEAAFEQCIEKPSKRSTLRPMPDTGMHPISAVDNAMQHLIDRTDDNPGDAASGLIDFFNYLFHERTIVLKSALTGT